MGSASASQSVAGQADVGLSLTGSISPTLSPGDPAPLLPWDEPKKPSGAGEESIEPCSASIPAQTQPLAAAHGAVPALGVIQNQGLLHQRAPKTQETPVCLHSGKSLGFS